MPRIKRGDNRWQPGPWRNGASTMGWSSGSFCNGVTLFLRSPVNVDKAVSREGNTENRSHS